MAATGEFDVKFSGTGGHGGLAAHHSSDLCLVQAQFVSAVHSIVARDVPADQSALLSVCFVSAGNPTAHSVLPALAHIGGSYRAFSEATQKILDKRIEELASNIASAFGCVAAVEATWTHGPVINPPDQAARVVRAARATLGQDKVFDQALPVMAGEDFACMLEAKPGAFVFLGNGVPADGVLRNIHNSHFNFNDDTLTTGVSLWVSLVQQELDSQRIGSD
jgi:hippurate hydrolase